MARGWVTGMALLGQVLISGLTMGAVYGLIALGLSLVFGVMKIINFAHGAFLMVGMYLAYWLWKLVGLDPYVSCLVTVPALFGLCFVLQKVLIEPVFRREYASVREPLSVLLLTCGLGYCLVNLALLFFRADYRSVVSACSDSSLRVGATMVSVPRVIALVAAVLVCVGLNLFLSRTDLGRAMRATAQDREAARLVGINDYLMYRLAFGINGAILAIAATLLSPFYSVFPTVGVGFDLKSFVIVVLGGIGSINGAFLGGLIVGVVEAVGAQLMTAAYVEIAIFAGFVAVLIFRPSGLMGIERA